jgi:hypothetical protein
MNQIAESIRGTGIPLRVISEKLDFPLKTLSDWVSPKSRDRRMTWKTARRFSVLQSKIGIRLGIEYKSMAIEPDPSCPDQPPRWISPNTPEEMFEAYCLICESCDHKTWAVEKDKDGSSTGRILIHHDDLNGLGEFSFPLCPYWARNFFVLPNPEFFKRIRFFDGEPKRTWIIRELCRTECALRSTCGTPFISLFETEEAYQNFNAAFKG